MQVMLSDYQNAHKRKVRILMSAKQVPLKKKFFSNYSKFFPPHSIFSAYIFLDSGFFFFSSHLKASEFCFNGFIKNNNNY